MKRLFVAAHADDEVIGAGGTMALHAKKGDEVRVGVLTADRDAVAERTRRKEAEEAWAVIGVAEGAFAGLPCRPLMPDELAVDAVAGWLADWRPDVVYLPHPGEADPDHRQVADPVRNALLRTGHSCLLLGYEVWTPLAVQHVTNDISQVAEIKRQAIESYRSQLIRCAWDEAALGLNRYRGATTGRGQWCEVFQVVPL